MKAICFSQFGGYEQLQLAEIPTPIPKSGEALVKMSAAGVNQGDNTIRLGHFPLPRPLPMVPGFEGAGVVVEANGSPIKAGTRVMFTGMFGVVEDGTWREYVTVPHSALVAVPEAVTDVQAAGVPVAYLTAYLALRTGGFTAGSRVLVLAIGGGVGNAGVQLSKALGASMVISTAGSTAKASRASELGYENIIDLSREKLGDRVMELTGGAGVDLVLDGVGGVLTAEALSCVGRGGTHVVYGAACAPRADVNLFDLIFHGSKMAGFEALVAQSPEVFPPAYDAILKLLAQKMLCPVVAQAFPLAEAAAAQRFLIEERPFGKVVLKM